MGFKKLALAAAVAAAPMSALALEPMQDEALSGVTGQDGISISLASNLTAGLKIHDTDGHPDIAGDGSVAADSGALVISGFSITRDATTDSIDLDIDTQGGTAPTLNIGVTLPNNLTVTLGNLGVADSGRSGTSTDPWTTSGTVNSVVNLGTLTLGTTTLDIQLGNEPQGDMIALSTTISGGVSISGFSVSDTGGTISGGALQTDLTIIDNGGSGLTVNTGINLDATDGVVIGLAGIGGATGMDVRMANLSVDGGTTEIGDVELIGLNLTGNLTINGK